MATYDTVIIECYDGTRHEIGLYFHHGETWRETCANVLRVARLRFGADTVKRVLAIGGNAA